MYALFYIIVLAANGLLSRCEHPYYCLLFVIIAHANSIIFSQ